MQAAARCAQPLGMVREEQEVAVKPKLTVLVIDDSAEMCNTLKFNLEHGQGFRVLTAQDGSSGLRLAQKVVPDVIVLDALLPGLPRGPVAEVLREYHSTVRIPILFLTGAATTAALPAQGEELGRALYLAKPVRTREIVSGIRSLLGR